jgi:hypothetical protein
MWFFAIPAIIRSGVSMVPAFIWKWLAIVLIALCIFFYGEIKGKRIAEAKCEAAAKVAQQAANDQDLQAEKEGRAQDLEITNTLIEQKKVDDAAIETLKAQLAKRTPAAVAKCLYDKDNADPDSQPAPRSVRVPKPRAAKAGASDKKSP